MKTKQRHEPKTARGRDTRDQILAAARKLVSVQWIHETPFTSLAAAAGVARASLLHVFPTWRDVAHDLLTDELVLLDHSHEAALALKRARPGERVYAMLVVLLDRAEKTGRLYPNLRSEMFTWQGQLSEDEEAGNIEGPWSAEMTRRMLLIHLADHYQLVDSLLQVPMDVPLASPPIGECLVNLALDLAAGYPSHWAEFDERRQKLRRNIELIAAGLGSAGRRSKKKKRK